jgi:catechol 2,3-dioxygenase-like lactoylglutathione lyase family enzyme
VLHHLTLWVPDLERARESWTWLLGELGYRADDTTASVLLFRHDGGFSVAMEQSPDMVPGMLYSRFRPGLNHLAFTVDDAEQLEAIATGAADHGWSRLPVDTHPIAGGASVAYLEDRDGFEVELVAPTPSGT